MDIIERLHDWSKRKLHDRLLRRYGGLQRCTWCRQIAQTDGDWSFDKWDRDQMLDKLTCGVCGGTSLWRFELGMMYVAALDPPQPCNKDIEDYDVEYARLKR